MSILDIRTSRTRRAALTALAGGALLAAGTGVAQAHGPGRRGVAPASGQVVHSESVVRTATGFATTLQQYGTVTAVSATSLSVLSADQYSATYTLTATTRYRAGRTAASSATVAVGDTVSVLATRATGSASAVALVVDERSPRPTASPTATSTATAAG